MKKLATIFAMVFSAGVFAFAFSLFVGSTLPEPYFAGRIEFIASTSNWLVWLFVAAVVADVGFKFHIVRLWNRVSPIKSPTAWESEACRALTYIIVLPIGLMLLGWIGTEDIAAFAIVTFLSSLVSFLAGWVFASIFHRTLICGAAEDDSQVEQVAEPESSQMGWSKWWSFAAAGLCFSGMTFLLIGALISYYGQRPFAFPKLDSSALVLGFVALGLTWLGPLFVRLGSFVGQFIGLHRLPDRLRQGLQYGLGLNAFLFTVGIYVAFAKVFGGDSGNLSSLAKAWLLISAVGCVSAVCYALLQVPHENDSADQFTPDA